MVGKGLHGLVRIRNRNASYHRPDCSDPVLSDAIIFLCRHLGLLFVGGFYAMMQGPIGDQIRKEMQEDKAAASQVKRTG